ncbi:ribonuclease J [Candidatus Saccharibacteria bacterium]|nr:ribonuclease J [Candidatus Saccharibacteria bacterium]
MSKDNLKSRPLTAQDLGLNNKPEPQKQNDTKATQPPARAANTNQRPNQSSNQQRPGQGGGRNNQQGNRGNNQGRPGGNRNNNRGGGGNNRRRFDKGPTKFAVGSFNQNTPVSKPTAQVSMSKIDAGKLKIVPLGGLGQIGKNLMALEYEDDIIIMDMGFTFPGEDQPGIDLIVPDITYLEERKHKIRGIFITHAHEDHVGGIPFLLPKIPAPIYAAQFTVKFIERKLEEYHLDFKPELHIVDQDKHDKIQLGVFTVEFIRITHSIPDACALAITTPIGKIVNTGDWRFEEQPLDGKESDKTRLKELGDEGVMLLMCDSTNCEQPGRTPSETEIIETLDEIMVRNYNKRVIISCFGSQVTRMQIIVNAVAKAHRKLVVVGRSMLNNLELSVKLGYIKIPPGLIIKAQDMKSYEDSELAVITTGSQGEEFSALQRMGTGEHRDVKLKEGDVIVLSSSIIPGNEKSVWGMVDNLFRWGSYVYQSATRQIDDLGIFHISGHANVDEVKEMIELVRPKYYLPIHGELHHMKHNAKIALDMGFDPKNVFVVENGQTIELDKEGAKLGKKVKSGEVLIDGAGIGDVQEIVLKDRMAMSSDGVFMIVTTIDKKTGKLVTSPDIISRGFIYVKDNAEILNNSRKIVKNIVDTKTPGLPANSPVFKARIRDEVSNYLYKITKRNPIVLPVVIEV